MTRLITRSFGGLIATLAAAVLLASPAVAEPSGLALSVNGSGFTTNPSASLLHVSRMVPGSSASGVLGVRNTSSDHAALSVRFVHVQAGENGCTHAELAAPGGCDPAGPGQLGDALQLTLAVADNGTGPFATSWTGSAAALQNGVRLGHELEAHGTEWVRLTIALPESAGNEVQSDTFGFDLQVVLSGTGSAIDGASLGVEGVSTVRGVHGLGGGTSGSGLAFTGVPTLMLIGAGVLLILCGGLMTLGYRERRQR